MTKRFGALGDRALPINNAASLTAILLDVR
jgi:hypothetical protein